MRRLNCIAFILLGLLSACARAQVMAPPFAGTHSTAINISLDLAGKADGRPTTWGLSDSYASQILFHPPIGYRVRILRAYGDFIAFPAGAGTTAPAIIAGSVEIGFGLKTTAPDGDPNVTFPGYAATPFANSFLWIQGSLTPQSPNARLPIDADVAAGGLLGPDNMMLAQSFVALNTTGLSIHLEPTIVVVYRYEKELSR